MAENIIDRKKTLPDGLLGESSLSTGLAFDNFDENKDSLSGGGTHHDTQGICYQNGKMNSTSQSSFHQVSEPKKITGKRQKKKFTHSRQRA